MARLSLARRRCGTEILILLVPIGLVVIPLTVRWIRNRPRLSVRVETRSSDYLVEVENIGRVPVLIRYIGLRVSPADIEVYRLLIRLPNERHDFHLLEPGRRYSNDFGLPQTLHRIHEVAPDTRGERTDLFGIVEWTGNKPWRSEPVEVIVPK